MLTKTTYGLLLLLLSASAFAQQQDSARLQNKVQSLVQKTDSLGKQPLPLLVLCVSKARGSPTNMMK